jgi:hypothetical protein
MPDNRRFERRCLGASRSLLWWGRISGAAYLLEAVASQTPFIAMLPAGLVLVVAEAEAPDVRRGKDLAPMLLFHGLLLIWFFFLLWVTADRGRGGGRTLGAAGAVLLLGAISAWHLWRADGIAPAPAERRRERAIVNDHNFALWICAPVGLSGLLLLILAFRSKEPKLAVGAVLALVLLVPVSRLLRAGIGTAQAMLFLFLLAIASGLYTIGLLLGLPGDPLSFVVVLLFLASVAAISFGAAALAPARAKRKSRRET